MLRRRAIALLLATLIASALPLAAFALPSPRTVPTVPQPDLTSTWAFRALAAGAWAFSVAWGTHLPWLAAPPPGLSVAASGRALRSQRVVRIGIVREQGVVRPVPRPVLRPSASLLRDRPPGAGGLPGLIGRGSGSLLGRSDVRCDKCVASAATAEMGEDSIVATIDVRALTTVKVGNSVLRLTNVRPFSLLFRKHF